VTSLHVRVLHWCSSAKARQIHAAQALDKVGLTPATHEPREALAPVNGTNVVGPVGTLATERSHQLLQTAVQWPR